MKSKGIFTVLLIVCMLLLSGCGGKKITNASPSSVGMIYMTSHETGRVVYCDGSRDGENYGYIADYVEQLRQPYKNAGECTHENHLFSVTVYDGPRLDEIYFDCEFIINSDGTVCMRNKLMVICDGHEEAGIDVEAWRELFERYAMDKVEWYQQFGSNG